MGEPEQSFYLRHGTEDADLTACHVYGVSAWGVNLEGAKQTDLVITPTDEPAITVDNLEVAQFIYLLLNNKKIRDVIDTITSKVVLILGASPRSERRFSMRCETHSENATTFLSYSTSTSPPAAT